MRRGVIYGAAPRAPRGRHTGRRKPRRMPIITSDILTSGMSYRGVGQPDATRPALADQTALGAEAEPTESSENLVLQVGLEFVDDTVDLVIDTVDLFGSRLDSDDGLHVQQAIQTVHSFDPEIFDELVRCRNGIELFDEIDLCLDCFDGDRLCGLNIRTECPEIDIRLTENHIDNLFHDDFSF